MFLFFFFVTREILYEGEINHWEMEEASPFIASWPSAREHDYP